MSSGGSRARVGWAAVLALAGAAWLAGSGPLFPPIIAAMTAIVALLAATGAAVASGHGTAGRAATGAAAAALALGPAVAASLSRPSLQVMALAAAPLAVAVVAAWSGARLGRAATVATISAAIVVALVEVWFRDPYRELACRPVCPHNPFVIAHEPALVTAAGWAMVAALVVAGVAVVRRTLRQPGSRVWPAEWPARRRSSG